MKTKPKIIWFFIAIVSIFLILNGYIFIQTQKTVKQYDEILDTLILQNSISADYSHVIEGYYSVILAPQSTERKNNYLNQRQELTFNINSLDGKIHSEKSLIAYKGLKNQIGIYIKKFDTGISAIQNNDVSTATSIYTEALDKEFFVESGVSELIAAELEYTSHLHDILDRNASLHQIFGIILIISIVTFSIFIIISFSRKLTEPIDSLSKISKEISNGKLNLKVNQDLLNMDGEVGILSRSFNAMVDSLSSKISEIEKDNEKLKSLDKMKINFLNMVTHELKTPLTAIMAYLDILEDAEAKLSEEEKKELETIRRNAKQLGGLIGNILEVARIESGKFELVLVYMKIKKKVDDIVENLQIIAKNKGLNLVSSLGDIPEKIITDEQRFEEILNNLVSNAIKFTEKGEIKIEANKKGNMIEFAVSDTGVGISQDGMKKLFTDFYQVDSSISRKYGGTGLGLSITKKLVELQGGKIVVKSTVGKGTSFIFTLPEKQIIKKKSESEKKEIKKDEGDPFPDEIK